MFWRLCFPTDPETHIYDTPSQSTISTGLEYVVCPHNAQYRAIEADPTTEFYKKTYTGDKYENNDNETIQIVIGSNVRRTCYFCM